MELLQTRQGTPKEDLWNSSFLACPSNHPYISVKTFTPTRENLLLLYYYQFNAKKVTKQQNKRRCSVIAKRPCDILYINRDALKIATRKTSKGSRVNLRVLSATGTFHWFQYVINSTFLLFFWGCQKLALFAILRTPAGSTSFNSWLRCYRIV